MRLNPRAGALPLLIACGLLLGCGDSAPATRPEANVVPGAQPPANRACVPGLVATCDCGAGVVGVSTCDAVGGAMGPCECPNAPSTGVGPVAVPGGDVPDGPITGGTAGAAGPVSDPTPPEPPAPVAARDIRIREIALFQAVKVSLVVEGEAVIARNAPVVVGKSGLLRAYVEALPGFAPRELEAHLTLSSAETAVESQVVTQRIEVSSSEEDLESTINFDIPQGTITGDLRYSLELRELEGVVASATGTIDPAVRYPLEEETLAEMGARNAGPLRVMIVPYRYNGDGSGRLPVVTDEQLQLFRDYIYAFYPIIDVEFELHEPVDYDANVGPNNGWESWLDSHCSLRTNEQPDPKVLYYGVMAPRESMQAYGGGIVGISYLPGPAANFGRCSVGVGFEGGVAASTMSHELGHSLGLPHAPCGVSGGAYPYEDASIGVWGFGLSSRTLKDPGEFKDLMSYCDPIFISDYNYQRLFERIRYLNLQFATTDGPMQSYLRVLQTPDGERRVTGTIEMAAAPGGEEEERSVELFDDAGTHLGQAVGYFFESSEEGGGLWLVPDHGAREVALSDGTRVGLR